jgi:hypothetical protein
MGFITGQFLGFRRKLLEDLVLSSSPPPPVFHLSTDIASLQDSSNKDQHPKETFSQSDRTIYCYILLPRQYYPQNLILLILDFFLLMHPFCLDPTPLFRFCPQMTLADIPNFTQSLLHIFS